MRVRSIDSDELERFAALSDTPEAISSMQDLGQRLWTQGNSKPEWFFLAEQDGQTVARVAYWHLKARPQDMRMMTLKLPWEGPYLDIGMPLLLESWEKLKSSEARYVVRQLMSFWDYLDEQRELLELAGMSLLQEKQGYLWKPSQPVTVPERLSFRSVEQTGETAFLEAMQKVTTGVVDREIQAMGSEKVAQQLFMILKEDTVFHPAWAQLAYDTQGELVGLVTPVGMLDLADEGSVGYIGVTPEQRGHGYIHDLLRKGMAILQSAGVQAVYSETDSENGAMRGAFERAGHQPDYQVWLYRGRL